MNHMSFLQTNVTDTLEYKVKEVFIPGIENNSYI